MNSISRNKYIDKSATLLKAYFTLASCCGRAQTTRARVCVCTCVCTSIQRRRGIYTVAYARQRAREKRVRICNEGNECRRNREEEIYVYTGCLWSKWLTLECIVFSFRMIKMFIFLGVEEWIDKILCIIYDQSEIFSYTQEKVMKICNNSYRNFQTERVKDNGLYIDFYKVSYLYLYL